MLFCASLKGSGSGRLYGSNVVPSFQTYMLQSLLSASATHLNQSEDTADTLSSNQKKWHTHTGNGTQMSSSHCAIYNKLYPDLSNAVVTIATLSSLDVGPYIRCGLSGVCWPPWCRVTRAGSLTADSGRRGRLSQHFSSVVLLSAGHGTIINHKLLFHGNPAILLLQNHCHHDPFQIPAAMGAAQHLFLCHPPMPIWRCRCRPPPKIYDFAHIF